MQTDFWLPPQRGVGKPATDQMIARAEATLHVALPAAYKSVLSQQNGGKPRRSLYRASRRLSRKIMRESRLDYGECFPSYSIDYLGGIGPKQLGNRNILKQPDGWRYEVDDDEWIDYDFPKDVIVLDGDGHSYLALDYRAVGPQGDPPVVHVECECTDGPADFSIIAPSMQHFLENLIAESADA